MKNNAFLISAFLFLSITSSAQDDTISVVQQNQPTAERVLPPTTIYTSEPVPQDRRVVYKINRSVSYPISIVGTSWALYCFTQIYTKELSLVADVEALNRDDVPSFDRNLMYPYDPTLGKLSYITFFAAMPFPFIVFLTKEDMRRDFWRLSFIYWETMSVVGYFSPTAPLLVDKYRPYTYFDETPMDKRINKVSRNSFYAGHAAVAGAGFFCAVKIYGDYYPDSGWKWPLYGLATAATVSTGWLRLKAGEHFLSDTFIGSVSGAAIGILVPHFHKMKDKNSLGVLPFINGDVRGFTLIYNFKDQRTAKK